MNAVNDLNDTINTMTNPTRHKLNGWLFQSWALNTIICLCIK